MTEKQKQKALRKQQIEEAKRRMEEAKRKIEESTVSKLKVGDCYKDNYIIDDVMKIIDVRQIEWQPKKQATALFIQETNDYSFEVGHHLLREEMLDRRTKITDDEFNKKLEERKQFVQQKIQEKSSSAGSFYMKKTNVGKSNELKSIIWIPEGQKTPDFHIQTYTHCILYEFDVFSFTPKDIKKYAKVTQPDVELFIEECARYGTVEFRHHSGTTMFSKIKNWILICARLVEFSKQNVLIDNINLILDENLQEYYEERCLDFV